MGFKTQRTRNGVIWWLRVDGWRYIEIARTFGITGQRVHQLVAREAKRRGKWRQLVAGRVGEPLDLRA